MSHSHFLTATLAATTSAPAAARPTNYQIVMVALLAMLIAGTLLALVRRWITRGECALWSSLWLAAAVATLWPDIPQRLARLLGIDRGADLVSYLGIFAMLIGFWMVYIRLRRLRRELTLLVRKLSIMEAQRDYPPGGQDRTAEADRSP